MRGVRKSIEIPNFPKIRFLVQYPPKHFSYCTANTLNGSDQVRVVRSRRIVLLQALVLNLSLEIGFPPLGNSSQLRNMLSTITPMAFGCPKTSLSNSLRLLPLPKSLSLRRVFALLDGEIQLLEFVPTSWSHNLASPLNGSALPNNTTRPTIHRDDAPLPNYITHPNCPNVSAPPPAYSAW
jgi:hypothetical protein